MPDVEDLLDRDIKLISAAYVRLTNAKHLNESYFEACEYLRELRIRSRDLTENLRKVLNEYKIPPSEIKSLGHLMAKQDVSHLFLLAQHYINRFLWAGQDTKMKCLTAAYYGLKDLAECVEATPVEVFYKDLVQEFS